MSEPQAARPTQHVSEKALEDLDHNVIEPPPVPRRDIPEGAGKVVFVGAGPGAPDLVSVRGARVIETADIIIWASSLVHPDMVARHKEGAELIDSASIPLEDLEPLYTRVRRCSGNEDSGHGESPCHQRLVLCGRRPRGIRPP